MLRRDDKDGEDIGVEHTEYEEVPMNLLIPLRVSIYKRVPSS